MINKMICVVYDEFDSSIRYVVVTDPLIIADTLSAAVHYQVDSTFVDSLWTFLDSDLGKGSAIFPHYDYSSVENPVVITVYF